MKKVSSFIRKHALGILIVAIALSVPIGVVSARYSSTVTVADNIEVVLKREDYTIDKAKLRAQLDALTPANLSTPATAIKFVKGSDSAIEGLTSVTTDGIQAEGSNRIGVFVSGTTIYIAPMDAEEATPATSASAVMYAPADSSYLLSGFEIPDEEAETPVVGSCINTIDCSNLDTSKVTNMNSFFQGDGVLTSLVLGDKFTTGNVTNMSDMFVGLSNLTSLDLSNFDTSKVTTMYSMFATSPGLKKIKFSNKFNTSNVTNMKWMFFCDYDLEELDVTMFNTANITDMTEMFAGCQTLTTLDLSSFNTSKVTLMDAMFQGCFGLKTLDLSSFDTSKVTSMYQMFREDTALETVYASDSFVTTSVTDSTEMFTNCNALVGGNGTSYASTGSTDCSYARVDKEGQAGYFTAK